MDIMQAPIKLTVGSGSKEKVGRPSKEKVETPSESAETPGTVTPGAVTPSTERTKKEQEQSKVEKTSGMTITQRPSQEEEQAGGGCKEGTAEMAFVELVQDGFFRIRR
ncbi:hypothetical protein COOONC_23054 [Cooperia oncophora]